MENGRLTKSDYMRLPKERLAELLAERDSLEETIEDKVAEKIAELLNKEPIQLPQNPYKPYNPYEPISVLYGCPVELNLSEDTLKEFYNNE